MKHTVKIRFLLAAALLTAAILFTGCTGHADTSETQPDTQPARSSTAPFDSASEGTASKPEEQNTRSGVSSEEGTSPQEETQDSSASSAEEQAGGLTGTWKPVSATVDGQVAPDIAANSGVAYVFAADKTFTMTIHGQNAGTGTYTEDGNSVICEMDGLSETFAYANGTLTSKYDGGDGLVVTVYKKTGA